MSLYSRCVLSSFYKVDIAQGHIHIFFVCFQHIGLMIQEVGLFYDSITGHVTFIISRRIINRHLSQPVRAYCFRVQSDGV